MRWRACREIRESIILRRMAEAFGKPRMAEWFGNRFLTRDLLLRLERWRWRLRIRTSFTRERVSIRFLRTVATEMESTSRWTAGKTGRMWDWRARGLLGESLAIQRIRVRGWVR